MTDKYSLSTNRNDCHTKCHVTEVFLGFDLPFWFWVANRFAGVSARVGFGFSTFIYCGGDLTFMVHNCLYCGLKFTVRIGFQGSNC